MGYNILNSGKGLKPLMFKCGFCGCIYTALFTDCKVTFDDSCFDMSVSKIDHVSTDCPNCGLEVSRRITEDGSELFE